ncbi:tail protein X [Pseudomonas aeruginosa]
MATIYRTSSGDELDTVCFHYYGHVAGVVEAVYDANPWLADEPQPLRAGLLILLPEVERPAVGELRLWD